MLEKSECIKNISDNLECIINDFIEILNLLKINKGTKLSEIEALVFSKRKMVDLTENAQKIFQNLVYLKYIERKSQLGFKKEKAKCSFEDSNQYYSKDFTD
jgi:hypothetical protein